MKFGLTDQVIEGIQKVLESNPGIDKAILFGSRAKGNYKDGSDIDIAIKGDDLKLDDILSLNVSLDKLNIPYDIDLINYTDIKEPDLIEHIDRAGIEFYARWKLYRLTEVGTLERGKSRHRPRYAFHLYGGNYPFIQTGDIAEASKYITSHKQTYSEAGLAQSRLWKKGTLCITIAANIAEVAILGIEACFPDSIIGFIPDKDKSDTDYVFYILKHFQKQIQLMGDGSVQDNINLSTFEKIKFPFPPLIEQKAIASILSALDDKIDLLHRQNKALESMAEALFRQRFLVESEEDWDEIELRDISSHYKENINPSDNPNEIYYHYSLPAFDNGKTPVLETGKQILSNKYKVASNSILVSKLNPRFPRIWGIFQNSIPSNSISSTEFQVIKPKQDFYWTFIYYFMNSSETIKELTSSAGGTSGSHQRVSPEDIFSLKLLLPPSQKIKDFDIIARKQFEKITINQNQIQLLIQVRDTILPKLLSGEARVKMQ